MKEFLYVGHYFDVNGRYILKIGTTNDLNRRKQEHNRSYRRAKTNTMPKENSFEYDWFLPLSKYNTVRFEDRNREAWKLLGIGEFIRNDRFACNEKPKTISVKIRREYVIAL